MAAAAAEEEGLESAFFFTKSGFVHEYGGIVAAAVADGVAPLGLSMHISGACSTILLAPLCTVMAGRAGSVKRYSFFPTTTYKSASLIFQP